MKNFLAEEPAVWFYRLWVTTKGLTVNMATTLLQEKYATKFGEDAIRDLIRHATRRPTESYEAYVQRLATMASTLPGGENMGTNAAAALGTFVRTACPSQSAQLNVHGTLAQRNKTPSRQVLHEMVEFISLLDRSNGVAYKPKPSKQTVHKKAKAKDGKAVAKAVAMAVVTERKRKPSKKKVRFSGDEGYVQPEWVPENTKCFACHGMGHLSKDQTCPMYGQRKTPLLNAALEALEEESE